MRPSAERSTSIPRILLVTGHPATGKTTLARALADALSLPLLCRDQIKETLADTIGLLPPHADEPSQTTSKETHRLWSNKLSIASWTLFYQRIEMLVQLRSDCVLESNFDPLYANAHWQRLRRIYAFRLIQVRCETEPDTLLARYQVRIQNGERHLIHKDDHAAEHFLTTIRRGPLDWINVESERIAIDTTALNKATMDDIIVRIKTRFTTLE